MPQNEIAFIGKKVKDMYGAYMGTVVGTLTDIDGTIQTVGVDCGSKGLEQIPYEQIVVQGEIVIFIPGWRLESQRLIREKGLTLRRIKALIDIVKENDEMREDAEIIHEKYKSKLASLEETETSIKSKLSQRLEELKAQMKVAKTLLFDAKVQYKSNEITETTFEAVKKFTTGLLEHATHESAEISNVQRRIADLDVEQQNTIVPPQKQLQESARSYLESDSSEPSVQTILPEVPTHEPVVESEESYAQVSAATHENSDSDKQDNFNVTKAEPEDSEPQADWLTRMEAQ